MKMMNYQKRLQLDYPKCLLFTKAEKELNDFYEYGCCPADDDEAGWEQWEKEQEDLEKNAPLYHIKLALRFDFDVLFRYESIAEREERLAKEPIRL